MFLRFVQKSKLALNDDRPKWLVIGNESSDLDSVVGSLVYAYCIQERLGNCFNSIPVCSIPKDKMNLKRDVIKWLGLFGVDSLNDLLFLEDVHDLLNKTHPEGFLQISLVDHHKPQLKSMLKYIREVIDHRVVVYHYPEGQLQVNDIKLVGSCCTLIANYIQDKMSVDDRCILFKMLHGVILMDTDCLLPDNGKTTSKDIDVVEFIEKAYGISVSNRREIYKILSQAKIDISGFSIAMMVHRDLKMLDYTFNEMTIKMAIPTLISIDVEDLLTTKDLELQLTNVLEDLKANIIICLTCGTSSRVRRGYLLFSENEGLIEKISQYLLLPEHKLNLHSLAERKSVKSFYQNDLKTSRKIFIPIIDRFFNSLQLNNNNIDTVAQTTDGVDIIVETDETPETEGAPYTLNTPLRSYSGSPDNRNSEMTLPSLNNRYTLQLVDRKRQKHQTEMNDEIHVDGRNNIDENLYIDIDDGSPLLFTPDNSDDESVDSCDIIDDHDDIIGPLPSFKLGSLTDTTKARSNKLTTDVGPDLLLTSTTGNKKIKSSPTSAYDINSDMLLNFNEESQNDTEFVTLAEKVDKKRKKLQSSRINSIAYSLVNDVLKNSETIVMDEIAIESFLDEWSDCYTEDEKMQIFNCVRSNDITKLAQLLTSCLIEDCLSVPDTQWSNNDAYFNDTCTNVDEKLQVYIDGYLSDDADSRNNEFPILERSYSGCHMGNIINEDNQCILANNVNSSSADVVENISFNLYRRISSNQLNYSDDEKELLISAGDWLPKEDVIYSDPEYEEQNNYSDRDGEINNTISMKIISVDKNFCMDGSTNSL